MSWQLALTGENSSARNCCKTAIHSLTPECPLAMMVTALVTSRMAKMLDLMAATDRAKSYHAHLHDSELREIGHGPADGT